MPPMPKGTLCSEQPVVIVSQRPRRPEAATKNQSLRSVFLAETDYYHGLLGESLGTAVWAVLSFVEDLQLRSKVRGRTEPPHRYAAVVDETLNALKYPMAWLHRGCQTCGALRRCYDPTRYQGGRDILELAKRYYGFSGPFQYWSKGELGLRLEGTRVIAELDFENTAEYEAYNRLMDYRVVRVKGTRFTINVNPRLMKRVIASVESVFGERFTLPECWAFSRYTLREFRLVYLAMFALAAIQYRARLVAASVVVLAWAG